MASLNRAALLGFLGRDPDSHFLPSGQQVVNFSVATSERFKKKDGTQVDQVEWHSITVYGKLAEICEKYLAKGKQVYVEGRIATRSWEAKDGSGKKYKTEIIATSVKFLGSKNENGGGGATEEEAPLASEEDVPFLSYNDADPNHRFRA